MSNGTKTGQTARAANKSQQSPPQQSQGQQSQAHSSAAKSLLGLVPYLARYKPAIATHRGKPPTPTVATTLLVAVLMTETSPLELVT